MTRMPPVWELILEQVRLPKPATSQMPQIELFAVANCGLGVRGLATRQVRHLLYSSERLNTRATIWPGPIVRLVSGRMPREESR
jgi:hypothetical protein